MQAAQNPSDLQALKARMKAIWTAGDFGQVALYIAGEGEQFVARLNLQPGMKLLDVACGTGNTAIPAARAGAIVTGLDLAPNLLSAARERAGKEGLTIRFDEGDAEDLPYREAEFDVVISMFGAMFAPRPAKVVSEFARVCRPGGLIAMANWTPQSFIGKSFQINGRYVPPPPGVLPPVLWGEEAVARERFAEVGEVETHLRHAGMNYPFGPAELVEFLRENLGPAQATFARLDAEGQSQLRAELTALHREYNEGDENQTNVRSEYLEVRVRRA